MHTASQAIKPHIIASTPSSILADLKECYTADPPPPDGRWLLFSCPTGVDRHSLRCSCLVARPQTISLNEVELAVIFGKKDAEVSRLIGGLFF